MTTESDFIALMRKIATDPAARGLADDCAVIDDLVLTHDMLVIGTHVMPDAAPEDVAWKLVGVNLSDLAAKGAAPIGVLLGYMLGDAAWDARFVAAFGEALSHFNTALLGGDTVSAPPSQSGAPRAFGLTAIGRATHMPVPSRSGARVGDALWVTGTIGDAMLGYLADTGQLPTAIVANKLVSDRYRRPNPRITEGRALAPLVTAMMDVSDGLLLDAKRLAMASGVTIGIDTRAVPLAPALCDTRSALPDLAVDALRWGDDYELLFTLPDGLAPPVPATRIGAVLADQGAPLLVDGIAPPTGQVLGWQHQGK